MIQKYLYFIDFYFLCVLDKYFLFLELYWEMNRYTHCFTRVQLELIIDDYLGLEPYYRLLNKKMKDYISRLESIDKKHISDKAHPIKIYTKDYMSKNLQDCEGSDLYVTH